MQILTLQQTGELWCLFDSLCIIFVSRPRGTNTKGQWGRGPGGKTPVLGATDARRLCYGRGQMQGGKKRRYVTAKKASRS